MATLGATAHPTAPTKKITAHRINVERRPSRSAIRPPKMAPKAAPGKRRELTTAASCRLLIPRSSRMYSKAPEMTPVS